MPNAVSPPVEMLMFADDAKIFMKITSVIDQMFLNDQLSKLFEWSNLWQMQFNIEKCVTMTICNKDNYLIGNYFINNRLLGRVENFNDLGITINSRLSWLNHIDTIKGKALRNLGYVKRVLGVNAPLKVKKVVYNSLVRSVLSYATPIWAPYKKKEIAMIEHVQRQATRFFLNYRDLSYPDRLKNLNMLPLTYEREVEDLIIFYNLYHGLFNMEIERLFSRNENRRGRILNMVAGELNRIKYKTEQGRSLYCARVLRIWESLPIEIQRIPPPAPQLKCKSRVFKNALIKYYKGLLMERFDLNNICTWVSVCKCKTCRT
jgi:hypothetical protein